MSSAQADLKADLERRRAELLASIATTNPKLAEVFKELSENLPTMEPVATPEPQPPPLPVTEAAICAALAHTFTIAPESIPLSPETLPPLGEMRDIRPARASERSAILANATPIMIAGQRRLQLSDEARGDLLNRAWDSDLYVGLLKSAADADRQGFEVISKSGIRLPGAWLRSFLEGTPGDVFKAPPREVRAAVDALSRLQFAGPEVVKSPVALADARRALALSELLEPLRILVGARGDWNGEPLEDRFVGRETELRQLRSFVDELASRSLSEALQRGFSRLIRDVQYYFNISDESVFFIVARGGIGKTTLIAKFVLDHALNQNRSRRFPFAYFDFDRASLHTRDPRQLLLEAARQVALQFPEIGPQVDSLLDKLRNEIASGAALSLGLFDDFRNLVQTITRGNRAFLVVFDTMEIVQYDPRSLAAVVHFATYLNGVQSNNQGFPELKIVASGRADVPELRTEQAERSEKNCLILQALSTIDAAKMADGIGRDFLGSEWNPQWAPLIAGKPNDPPERREPLVIRVAIELIRASKPNKREHLVQSIARDGENASDGFVGLLYERRILDHVQDPEVRKLAWPGLVVRRVTRDIIATTLAPVCGLDPAHTDYVFNALANEVWMVEEDGDTLRHRSDLRSRTLPLMRRRNPEKFEQVNSAALRYYESRLSTAIERSEWLYHRLLGGEHPDSVDRDWRDESSTLLAGAADDFAPESEVRAYLLGRTATTLLPPKLIHRLSPRLALDHIARCGAQLGSFDDARVEPIVADICVRVASSEIASTEPHPAKAVLLTKAGQWDAFVQFDGGMNDWREHADFAIRFKQARTLAEPHALSIVPAGTQTRIRTLIQDLAAARIMRSSTEHKLDELLADRLRQPLVNPGPADIAALRTAVVFGWRSSIPAAQIWFKLQEVPGAPKAVSLSEFSALLDVGRSDRRELRIALEPMLTRAKLNWDDLVGMVRAKRPEGIRLGHPEIRRAMLDYAHRLVDQHDPDKMHLLRRFFAARDDDWIVPFGYAAACALGPSSRATELFERALRGSNRTVSFESGFRRPKDALQLFRWADEASVIDRVGASVLDSTTGPQTANFASLYAHYESWRKQIDLLLDRNEAEGADAPPPAGPVVTPDDLQKGRWGGLSERNGRRLEVNVRAIERETFDFDLIVRSTDGSQLEGPVLFHLHDSFPRKTIHIRRIRDGNFAVLEEVNAVGTFTVGAQAKGSDGRWTGLELDLVSIKGIPQRFVGR